MTDSILMRYFLLLLLLMPLAATAQTDPPLHETRAVWLTTAAHLDWPPYNGSGQANVSQEFLERTLRDVIQESHAIGMNAVFFQAVSRGDAMYDSAILPWSPWLTGTAGKDPGWDPLAVAIEEAHSLGMELHVWFNVFRIGDTTTEGYFEDATNPQHVIYANPSWVQEDGSGNPWLIPSDDDARAWLVSAVMEIVENYDIDAMHYDFIRYPSGGLTGDGQRFTDDRRGFADINDWRRDNVTQFVRDSYAQIIAAKPWVHVGSAPIGNYRYYSDQPPGFYAYSDAFQASRDWLAEGIHDYLVPQLYWNIGTANGSPDFDFLISDWENESNGRPIYAGTAPYRRAESGAGFTSQEMRRQIDSSRTAGAEGQAYFRYRHLKNYQNEIKVRYQRPAMQTPMWHRLFAAAPSVPDGLTLAQAGREYTLSWNAALGTADDPLKGYAVFRRQGSAPDVTDPNDLHTLLGPEATTFTETLTWEEEPMYYAVVSRSRLNMSSESSAPISTNEAVANDDEAVPMVFRLTHVAPTPTTTAATVTFELDATQQVALTLYDTAGREVATLASGWFSAGQHTAHADVSDLAAGVYFVRLRVGAREDSRSIVVTR